MLENNQILHLVRFNNLIWIIYVRIKQSVLHCYSALKPIAEEISLQLFSNCALPAMFASPLDYHSVPPFSPQAFGEMTPLSWRGRKWMINPGNSLPIGVAQFFVIHLVATSESKPTRSQALWTWWMNESACCRKQLLLLWLNNIIYNISGWVATNPMETKQGWRRKQARRDDR
jgi:hypothetical protein